MHKFIRQLPIGVDAHLVEVEVDIAFGLVNFFIVGFPILQLKKVVNEF